ncbi:MAG TPA: AraD1 family protein [Candidatus Sulfotelmatobacter sp.]|nr:AraD1 family protein [Candidatus Sulfotelmatobacter sp.]
MTRLVQLKKGPVRRVALVEEPQLRILDGCTSVYELAISALRTGSKLNELAQKRLTLERLDYDLVYGGKSEWKLLPPIDHPEEPARCMISGTGLTHLGSARDRQSMHAVAAGEMTDSMKMFHWGREGGRPAAGQVGIPPEWFYKGTGTSLRAHGQPLEIPGYAEDGGEEAEIAGIYLVGPDGTPHRVGMAGGNEFSDHRFEKKNYLNLAGSKLRTCALGPELVLDPQFSSVAVNVEITRSGRQLWAGTFRTGEDEMCHSLRNLEHHHFKFEAHRRPGDVHVHFFGTDCLSFGAGIKLEDGDSIQVSFEGFGRPLRNPVHVAKPEAIPIEVSSLG